MLLCVLCWSTSGLFIKFIGWHPMVIAGLRSGIAAVFMLLVRRGRLFTGAVPRSAPGKPARSVPGLILLLAAAFSSAGTKILYVTANKLTSPANAILLHHSAPVWAAFLGWFLIRERPEKRQWVSLVFVGTGLLLFFVNGLQGGSLAGDAIALAAGVCFGAAMVFLRMNREGSPGFCLFLSHCIPFALGLPFIITHPPVFTPASAGAILFLGIVQVGVASLLYAYSIKRLRAIDAVFIDQLEPLLNPVWIFIFSGEVPAPLSMLGGIIIIGAVLMSQKYNASSGTGYDSKLAKGTKN
ncbi:DMT family transporter [Treponema sp. TIM-1]|uniref:DMT family transporter n=1 Tax=Treponema sp. TIM-1 TaxID=2898417 RepID=UPI0039812A2C